MALPNTIGYQEDDGNLTSFDWITVGTPQTATATATLTTTQLLGKYLVGNPSTSAAAYTLPLVSDLETALGNSKVGSGFMLTVVNLGTSSGVITMTTNTGWTLTGKMTIPITTTDGSSVAFLAYKTAAGAWTLLNVG
jgi:hypothetical protein